MKKAEDLTKSLAKTLGDNLKSVVLYGSAATQDQTKNYSDINVLVVVNDMGLPVLKSTMPVVRKWVSAGNPPPLFFTDDRLRQAEDVFPLEFLDMKASHQVLHGEDPLAELVIHTTHLRHQLEYELRGKLIQLRELYLSTGGKTKAVQELLARLISTFAILFKGVLRLVGDEPPQQKIDTFSALRKYVDVDEQSLQTIYRLRNKDKDALKQDPDDLVARLLKSVESVVDFVDRYK